MRDQSIEFVLRRPPVALLAFADEPEPLQRNPGEINRLDFDQQTVNRSSVRQNEPNDADIHADGHGACALGGAFAARSDHPLAIESSHIALSRAPTSAYQASQLWSGEGLAHIAHIIDMKAMSSPKVFRREIRDTLGALWRTFACTRCELTS